MASIESTDEKELEFKPDWPTSARRLEAWWDRQIIDRAVIQVTSPKDGVTRRVIPMPPTVEERWTDIDYVIESALEKMRTTFYGGDAFPSLSPNLGPDIFAAYLGCPLVFGEATSWSVPIVHDWAEFRSSHPTITLDRENPWWKLTVEMTSRVAEIAPGRFVVGLTDLHGGMDGLAALRDPQNLALDVVEHADDLKWAIGQLIPFWFEVYEGLNAIIAPKTTGTTSWLSSWSAGKSYPVSCDFICMISPAMMREFVLPDIQAEVEWLDRSVFHLDGPQAVKHLDTLFELPKLNAIQWVPGEKRPRQAMTDWIPLLQRIQAVGRGLHLNVMPEEVEPLMRALEPEGLLLSTSCPSESEARDLVALVERLSIRR